MQRAIIPVSLFMMVSYLNYNPSPTIMNLPIQNNCVPEQGARRHLCPECKDESEAANFSHERDHQPSANTVFMQGRLGEWLVVGEEMMLTSNMKNMNNVTINHIVLRH